MYFMNVAHGSPGDSADMLQLRIASSDPLKPFRFRHRRFDEGQVQENEDRCRRITVGVKRDVEALMLPHCKGQDYQIYKNGKPLYINKRKFQK
jgi:hypothetical protein